MTGAASEPIGSLPDLCKPDRVVPAVWVLDDVGHDLEAVLMEQGAILGSIQAAVLKWLALVRADCFPV